MTIEIKLATVLDITAMVALSEKKRQTYEIAQPQFWRQAKGANQVQLDWFQELLLDQNHILLVAKNYKNEVENIDGFIIGKIIAAPEVYDPQGLTLMVDDFCVADEGLWNDAGFALITSIKKIAKAKNATQILVVCGFHDIVKKKFLLQNNLSIASEWLVSSI